MLIEDERLAENILLGITMRWIGQKAEMRAQHGQPPLTIKKLNVEWFTDTNPEVEGPPARKCRVIVEYGDGGHSWVRATLPFDWHEDTQFDTLRGGLRVP